MWNPTPQMINATLGLLETELKRLGTVQIVQLKALDDPNLAPCDLLVITASYIEEGVFQAWLAGVEKRLIRQSGVTVPAIIYASISESTQRGLLRWAVECNWYFDIIDPAHISSLPVRVGNFLRLHDHLHEIKRMNEELKSLSSKVELLEKSLLANLNDALADAP